jgi:ribonuclease E
VKPPKQENKGGGKQKGGDFNPGNGNGGGNGKDNGGGNGKGGGKGGGKKN